MEIIKWKPCYDPPFWPIAKKDLYNYVTPCNDCIEKYPQSRLDFITRVTHCNADNVITHLEKCGVSLGVNCDFDRRSCKSWEWTKRECQQW
jgi:hypothetical protein